MARKHDWKKRKKQKVIEISVTHLVSEGELHLMICDMLFRGLKVTQKSLIDELKVCLKAFGGISHKMLDLCPNDYYPFLNTATFLFKSIFGFTPSNYHPWVENKVSENSVSYTQKNVFHPLGK